MSPNSDSGEDILVIGNPDDNESVVNDWAEDQSEREWLGKIAALLHENYFAGDIPGVNKRLDHFKGRLKGEICDPELGNIETSACRGVLKLAEYCCDQLEFKKCLEICEAVQMVLTEKKTRFTAQGLTPENDSTAWLSLVTALAECKWKNPDHCQDSVMGLEEMIRKYKWLEVHIRQGLLNVAAINIEEASVKKAKNYIIGLAWCGTLLLGAIIKYLPSQFIELKAFVDFLHDGLLDDNTKPQYWHLLIIKEFHSEQPSWTRINNSYFQLRNTIKNYLGPDFNLNAFKITSTIEKQFIRRQLFHI